MDKESLKSQFVVHLKKKKKDFKKWTNTSVFHQKCEIHHPSRAHDCGVIIIILNNKGSCLIPIRRILQLHASRVHCVCMRVCLCVQVCVRVPVCMCVSILPSKLSDGHAAQALESAQNDCAAAQEEGRKKSVFPSERRLRNKEQDSPCSLCITLAMSKCLGEAMFSRRSIAEGIDRLMPAGSKKNLHNCHVRDIPSAPPPVCSSLTPSLCRSNLTAGPGPIESQVSCRDKTRDCPIVVTLPFVVCKRQIARQLGMAANLFFFKLHCNCFYLVCSSYLFIYLFFT